MCEQNNKYMVGTNKCSMTFSTFHSTILLQFYNIASIGDHSKLKLFGGLVCKTIYYFISNISYYRDVSRRFKIRNHY